VTIYYSLYQELHRLPGQESELGKCCLKREGAVLAICYLMQNSSEKKVSHIKVQSFTDKQMGQMKCFVLSWCKFLLEYAAAHILLSWLHKSRWLSNRYKCHSTP